MAKGPLLQAAWDKLPEARKENIQARAAARIETYRNSQKLHSDGATIAIAKFETGFVDD
ncbi:MAG: hypothetical protein WBB01_06715 [Phormidesmis sp.]